MRVRIMLVATVGALLFGAGCETGKGFLTGMGIGAYATTKCVCEGLKKDTMGTDSTLNRLDTWIRENLW